MVLMNAHHTRGDADGAFSLDFEPHGAGALEGPDVGVEAVVESSAGVAADVVTIDVGDGKLE